MRPEPGCRRTIARLGTIFAPPQSVHSRRAWPFRAAHWATHLEYDWQNPVTGPLLQRLASRFHLVRYDYRGTGLSDRAVSAISFQTMLYDLEAAVDALALERFALLGISGGSATSIAYAVQHPHRVSKLVLFGGYAQGRNKRDSPLPHDGAGRLG